MTKDSLKSDYFKILPMLADQPRPDSEPLTWPIFTFGSLKEVLKAYDEHLKIRQTQEPRSA